MKLKTYLAENNITNRKLSKMMGLHENYISSIIIGINRPTKNIIDAIQKISNGQVMQKDLMDVYIARQKERFKSFEGSAQPEVVEEVR